MELIKKNRLTSTDKPKTDYKTIDYTLDIPDSEKDKIQGKTRKYLDMILRDSENIEKTLKEEVFKSDIFGEDECAESGIKDIIKYSNHIFFKCLDILRMIGERQYSKVTLPPIIQKDESTAELIGDDVLHFEFPELLPKRIKPGNSDFYSEQKRISLYYERFFKDFFDELNEERQTRFFYKEKVVICFIHHFSSPRLIRDHDNFEIKRIIDCIAYGCLASDDAAHCSHYCDYKMDSRDFSEIYVIPQSKFVGFLNNL